MHSVIFLFPPVINENILLQKSVPKNMNKVQTNAGLNAGVVISEVDLGCVHEAQFFSSSHALFLLYHMQFCFHLFVCLCSFTGHQHNGCQQHLARFTPVTPDAAVYLLSPSSHLSPPSLGCLLFSSFSL